MNRSSPAPDAPRLALEETGPGTDCRREVAVMNDSPSNAEVERLRSQVAALEQLLEVHEQAVLEQADRLEHVLVELRTRAQALAASEESLRKQTRILQCILDRMADGVAVVDPQGRFLVFNPAAERILGRGFAEVPPDRWPQHYGLFLPDGVTPHPLEQLPLVRALRGQEVDEAEVVVRLPDRPAAAWLSVNARPLLEDGVLRGAVAVFRDITDRKRAEDALKESQSLYHSLVESLPMNVFRKDLRGRFTFGNARFCATVGRPLGEVLGQTDHDLFPAELADKYRRDDLMVMASGGVFEDVEEHSLPDGRRIFVQVLKAPVYGPRGEVAGTQGAFWDVTARRKAEEEMHAMRAVLENAVEGISRLDPQGRFVAANAAFAALLGYEPAELVGLPWQAVVSPDDLDRAQAAHRHMLAAGKAEADLRGRRKDGSDCYHQVVLIKAFDKQQEFSGHYRFVKDISERKRAEQELSHHARELARSNADLEQFAYVVSHDLQEPLRMVASYCQLLRRRYQGRLDAAADDFIDFAVEGATRMQALINDLLVYSRVGRRGQAPRPTDCAQVCDKAVANLRAAIAEAGAVVTRDPLPTVVADGTQMLQVFQNLVGNALKFRGPEPPRVHVSARRHADEWVFAVRDNGIGIAAEDAERIFMIFQRLHTREEYPGTGIGLAISKRIVDRHGGRIWVESDGKKGSVFYFTLPVHA
jgi:PAS domain S-box-containing protein